MLCGTREGSLSRKAAFNLIDPLIQTEHCRVGPALFVKSVCPSRINQRHPLVSKTRPTISRLPKSSAQPRRWNSPSDKLTFLFGPPARTNVYNHQAETWREPLRVGCI